jgi:hypothetical protein
MKVQTYGTLFDKNWRLFMASTVSIQLACLPVNSTVLSSSARATRVDATSSRLNLRESMPVKNISKSDFFDNISPAIKISLPPNKTNGGTIMLDHLIGIRTATTDSRQPNQDYKMPVGSFLGLGAGKSPAVLRTQYGKVHFGKDVLVYALEIGSDSVVHNISGKGPNDVTVKIGSKIFSVPFGKALVISPNSDALDKCVLAGCTDLTGGRSLGRVGDINIVEADFSRSQLLSNCRQFALMLSSKDRTYRRAANTMLKYAAAELVSSGGGETDNSSSEQSGGGGDVLVAKRGGKKDERSTSSTAPTSASPTQSGSASTATTASPTQSNSSATSNADSTGGSTSSIPTAKQQADLQKYNFTEKEETTLLQAHFTPKQLLELVAGGYSAGQLIALEKDGYTPDQLVSLTRWGIQGLGLASVAKSGLTGAQWTTLQLNGFKPGQIIQLNREGFSGPQLLALQQGGFNGSQLLALIEDSYTPSELASLVPEYTASVLLSTADGAPLAANLENSKLCVYIPPANIAAKLDPSAVSQRSAYVKPLVRAKLPVQDWLTPAEYKSLLSQKYTNAEINTLQQNKFSGQQLITLAKDGLSGPQLVALVQAGFSAQELVQFGTTGQKYVVAALACSSSASALNRTGQPGAAAIQYQASATLYAQAANLALANGDQSAASQGFNSSAIAAGNAATSYMQAGDLSSAAIQYNDSAKLYENLAKTAQAQGQQSTAIQAFSNAGLAAANSAQSWGQANAESSAVQYRHSANLYAQAANAAQAQGQQSTAIQAFSNSATSANNSALAFSLAGNAHAASIQYNDAANLYTQSGNSSQASAASANSQAQSSIASTISKWVGNVVPIVGPAAAAGALRVARGGGGAGNANRGLSDEQAAQQNAANNGQGQQNGGPNDAQAAQQNAANNGQGQQNGGPNDAQAAQQNAANNGQGQQNGGPNDAQAAQQNAANNGQGQQNGGPNDAQAAQQNAANNGQVQQNGGLNDSQVAQQNAANNVPVQQNGGLNDSQVAQQNAANNVPVQQNGGLNDSQVAQQNAANNGQGQQNIKAQNEPAKPNNPVNDSDSLQGAESEWRVWGGGSPTPNPIAQAQPKVRILNNQAKANNNDKPEENGGENSEPVLERPDIIEPPPMTEGAPKCYEPNNYAIENAAEDDVEDATADDVVVELAPIPAAAPFVFNSQLAPGKYGFSPSGGLVHVPSKKAIANRLNKINAKVALDFTNNAVNNQGASSFLSQLEQFVTNPGTTLENLGKSAVVNVVGAVGDNPAEFQSQLDSIFANDPSTVSAINSYFANGNNVTPVFYKNVGVPSSITSYNNCVRQLYRAYNNCRQITYQYQIKANNVANIETKISQGNSQLATLVTQIGKDNTLLQQYNAMPPATQAKLSPLKQLLQNNIAQLQTKMTQLNNQQTGYQQQLVQQASELENLNVQGQQAQYNEQNLQNQQTALASKLPKGWNPFAPNSQ